MNNVQSVNCYIKLLICLTCVCNLQKEQLEFGEFEWLTDMSMFGDQFGQETLAAAEVPELPVSHPNSTSTFRTNKSSMSFKKPRIERFEDEDEYFTVPDLG